MGMNQENIQQVLGLQVLADKFLATNYCTLSAMLQVGSIKNVKYYIH